MDQQDKQTVQPPQQAPRKQPPPAPPTPLFKRPQPVYTEADLEMLEALGF